MAKKLFKFLCNWFFGWRPLEVNPRRFFSKTKFYVCIRLIQRHFKIKNQTCGSKVTKTIFFWWCPLGVPMRPTYHIFELDFTLELSYLCTKFCINQIEIATSSVHTYTHTHAHTYIQKIFPAARLVKKYDS